MALEDFPANSRWILTGSGPQNSLITFELPDGTSKGPFALEHSAGLAYILDFVNKVNEINRQNRERQMKQNPSHGLPGIPSQPRRFYMAGVASFLTRVREAEWMGGEHPYAYAMSNPVTYTDPSGNRPERDYAGREILPPNQVYWKNCCWAKRHLLNLDWFKEQVKKGGPWDFKRFGKQYETAGNFHYGYVAACLGLPLYVALAAAGVAQILDHTSSPDFGVPFLVFPYADDPKDQLAIMRGYFDAMSWMNELNRKCSTFSTGAMIRCYNDYKDWRDQEIDRMHNDVGTMPVPRQWWNRR
ncbi:MAG: hypothetical protein JST35_09465 [Armatimonadetes bacterium]|nr:hypothetical protein [Armatimonadota bacterium]